MAGYVLSVAADLDLDEIWEYIVADNIDAADRWIGKLFDACEALARTPGMP
jgi:plasmid stabilization system protein ParE